MTPAIDHLAIPQPLSLTFIESDAARKYACMPGTVEVVFVDKAGAPLSAHGDGVLKAAGLPASAPLPSGDTAQRLLFGSIGAVLALSVDAKKDFSHHGLTALGGDITRALARERFTAAWIHVEQSFSADGDAERTLLSFIRGLQTPTYQFEDLRTEKSKRTLPSLVGIVNPGVVIPRAHEIGDAAYNLVVAEHLSRKWVDLPPQQGFMSTTDAVSTALRIVQDQERHRASVNPHIIMTGSAEQRDADRVLLKRGRLGCEIIRGEELAALGLNALWSVGKGSAYPPALVVLRWNGAGDDAPMTALVGKFLVFDSGGLDKKPSGDFADMKADMAGGAMVLAAFDLAVRTNAPVNLIATLCIAENAISGNAYHPGSVLFPYRGKSVEVGNTDAEGRLALIDGVRFTEEHYAPDYLVTVATLTGAIVVALGNDFAGLFAKTEAMRDAVMEASGRSGDPVWPMPLNEARHTKTNRGQAGEPADLCSTGPRWGGAISAAKFIMNEYTKTAEAAHLDVAGVAMEAYDCTGEKVKFSTGYGPALLWELARILAKRPKSEPSPVK